ncbi:MAG: hypothetical protein KF830_07865 [Planctomycetes bacterium]|nr:hypothetical protein [Planctomycetota bacterium]
MARMPERPARIPAFGWRAAMGGALLLAACTGLRREPAAVAGEPWQQAVADLGICTFARLPADGSAYACGGPGTVVVLHGGDQPAAAAWSEAQREACREFVQQGGRLLLLGHAAALATAIGLEPERPEPQTFRWGFDRRALAGSARLGLEVVSGRWPELFAGLEAEPDREHTYFLTGGEPCAVPLCAWTQGAPRRGQVLARLVVERDGEPTAAGQPVLVHWRHGDGEVLALGLVPDVASADPRRRQNARTLLRAAVRQLQGGTPGRLVLLSPPPAAAPAAASVPPAFTPRPGPNLPLLAHWGWQAPLHDGEALCPTAALVAEVLLPSWQAGADAIEVELPDAAGRTPLPWPRRDPLQRPAGWPEAGDRPLWPRSEARALAAEAHARGLLAFAGVAPLSPDDRTTERLAALRFLARELACQRRLGAGAFDGFGVDAGWRDPAGHGVAMLQDFQPAGLLYGRGEAAAGFAGGLRALDADDGALPGLALAGLSAQWRHGFAADEFPLGVLDARARAGRAQVRDAGLGGGSHGDWIVTQANDFVRERAGRGASLWWRRFDPTAFDPETLAYVHGVSQEPLVAAVAMRLSTTGADGRRAAARALLDAAPAAFGAEHPAPAAVHVLQNNWFQLAGSGGALRFDATGRASFRSGEAVQLAAPFLRTRLFGARPDVEAIADETTDLLQHGRDEAAGAAPHRHVRLADGGRLPAVLTAEGGERGPAAAAIDWSVGVGYHELQYELRGVRGRGTVAVSLDGVLLGCVPVRADGWPARGVLPLHVVRPGVHTLQLEQLDGGATALDRLRVVRTGDVGAAGRVVEAAGSLARLEERSGSPLHAERLELVTLADLPALLVRVQCESAARGLQVERTFAFAGHRLPAMADLRQPFVLEAVDRTLPDVVVVPLQLGRHDRLASDGGELVLRSAPGVGSQQRLAFLFVDRQVAAAVRRSATALGAALDQPPGLDLGATGEAVLHSDLPLPWTRVVRLDSAVTTPVLLQENGWWTWRGTQAAADGGRWLRVRHEGADAVRIVVGPAVLARIRPGPGSQHVLAWREVSADDVTVRIAQPSLLAPPSLILDRDFDELRLDGQSWAFRDGRRVFLPDRVGTYRLEGRRHGGGPGPHVRSTRAPLLACTFVPERRALVLVAAPAAGRPVELPWTAVLGGPRPVRITNGEIVAEGTLPHADAEAAAAAAAGGTLVRFRSGTTEVFYGP